MFLTQYTVHISIDIQYDFSPLSSDVIPKCFIPNFLKIFQQYILK